MVGPGRRGYTLRVRGGLALAVLLGVAAPASAQLRPWAVALEPSEADWARRLVDEGLRRLECALDPVRCGDLDVPSRELALAQAAIRFERAAERLPGEPDLALLHAYARAGALGPHPGAGALAASVAAFEDLRARAPEHAAARVAFQLAILRTRMGDPEGAAREYAALDRLGALGLTPLGGPLERWELLLVDLHEPIAPASYLGNWAEVAMLAGDADAAVDLYRRALDAVPAASFSAALATWGRALAEERAGNHAAALTSACAAIALGLPDEHPALAARRAATRARWGPFAALHDEDVFFEPAYEVRAYEALGHECLAARSVTSEGRRLLFERARGSWRFFLMEGGADGRWAERARMSEERLSALLVER